MSEIILPELSYIITGLCFNVHNELGRFVKEKQYSDLLEEYLRVNRVKYIREKEVESRINCVNGNRPDYIIEEKIILDLKAKKYILKDDYYQMKRYLEVANLKLGLIVNFRNTYLKPLRVLNSYHKQ